MSDLFDFFRIVKCLYLYLLKAWGKIFDGQVFAIIYHLPVSRL